MSTDRIENPRVFISYAWGTDDYQEKVLSFATALMKDGVDVVIDKWNLNEGNDMNSFMEQCVNDSSITNVLMLLDPIYAQKANEHSGGVGVETQIISAHVYRQVTQNKFIPVVFARDENGDVCKPTYLESRLHFDLSLPEKYDTEYQNLVKRLYGVEINPKPELGKKPFWVDSLPNVSVKTISSFEVLKTINPQKVKQIQFSEFLSAISQKLLSINDEEFECSAENSDYIQAYKNMESIRDEYLTLIRLSPYIEKSERLIEDFLEETYNKIEQDDGYYDLKRILLHEVFIYTVSLFFKCKDYSALGHILNKTYYDSHAYCDDNDKCYQMFYSGREHATLDRAVCERDDKNYLSGVAELWIENVFSPFFTREDFIAADLLCYNCSFLSPNFSDEWHWFPLTYIYDNRYGSSLKQFTHKLRSKEFVIEVLPIFGYDNFNDFKERFKAIEDLRGQGKLREYRYSRSFETASFLTDFIKAEEIGSKT